MCRGGYHPPAKTPPNVTLSAVEGSLGKVKPRGTVRYFDSTTFRSV